MRLSIAFFALSFVIAATASACTVESKVPASADSSTSENNADDAGSSVGDDKDGGNSECAALSSDKCGTCAAKNCCTEVNTCAGDNGCMNATVCLYICEDDFAKCVASCNTANNAVFTAYAACLSAKGCASSCEK